MIPELEHAWPHIRAELRRAVPDSTFSIWLEPLKPERLEGDVLVVTAPEGIRRWVRERFGRVLQSCAAAHLGPQITVDIVAPGTAPAPTTKTLRPAAPDAAREVPFDPRLTFEQFVIGDSNRFAHAAALAVAEMPGQAYSPLFIYGPPGLGKTHLLHSIAGYVAAYGNGLTVRYATAETFTNAFVSSLRNGGQDDFKARFRHADVLLIDDVQFLESKARTEEEFFHTFNALYDSGSQLVLTSDRLPRDLGALETRLRDRFEAGLVTDVCAPDEATRLTILRKRVAQDSIAIADDGPLQVLAARITDNIRALEGALIRVVAFASLTGRAITAELAEEVLGGLYRRAPRPRHGIEDIQRAVCEAFDISPGELVGRSRSARLSWPRQIAMYLSRELTDQTLPAIGRAFGGRDHTTVLNACRRTPDRLATDHDAFEIVRRLTDTLERGR